MPLDAPVRITTCSLNGALRIVPLIPQQSEIMLVIEAAPKGIPPAQVAFIGKAELEQQPLGALVPDVDDGFHAMQSQIAKRIGQHRRGRFSHQALAPERAVEFIADFGTMKAGVEMMQAARPDHPIIARQRHPPANRLAPVIARLYLVDQLIRLTDG